MTLYKQLTNTERNQRMFLQYNGVNVVKPALPVLYVQWTVQLFLLGYTCITLSSLYTGRAIWRTKMSLCLFCISYFIRNNEYTSYFRVKTTFSSVILSGYSPVNMRVRGLPFRFPVLKSYVCLIKQWKIYDCFHVFALLHTNHSNCCHFLSLLDIVHRDNFLNVHPT